MIPQFVEHHTRCEGNLSKDQCNAVWAAMMIEQTASRNPDTSHFQKSKSNTPKTGKVPFREEPIVICGETVYPNAHLDLDYVTAWQVFQFFKDLDNYIAVGDPNPGGRAKHLSGALVYIRDWWPDSARALWQKICAAQIARPNQRENTSAAPHKPSVTD